MNITGKQILQAVVDAGGINPSWSPAHKSVMGQYYEQEIPDALRDLLDEPASAKGIVQAQLEHQRRFLAADMPRKLLQAMIPNHPQFAQGVAKFEIKIGNLISSLEVVEQNFDDLLRQNNMQERDYLLTMPLNPGMTMRILQRQITILEFLLEQPEIILQFSLG